MCIRQNVYHNRVFSTFLKSSKNVQINVNNHISEILIQFSCNRFKDQKLTKTFLCFITFQKFNFILAFYLHISRSKTSKFLESVGKVTVVPKVLGNQMKKMNWRLFLKVVLTLKTLEVGFTIGYDLQGPKSKQSYRIFILKNYNSKLLQS